MIQTQENIVSKQSPLEGSVLERMNVVVVGHVDHGKSTVVGRLLADTNSLPEGKLENIKRLCEQAGKQFEYAFLLDALSDEQAQGITIDAARIFFKSRKRYYIILDAPGHIEFLRNMVTGASHAEAALLVIDADEGIQENSKRHGYILSMLGVKNIVVLVNKMDLVKYDQMRFKNIVAEYTKFLKSTGVTPLSFIPVSGLNGENIVEPSKNMPWYKGETVLGSLDSLVREEEKLSKHLRMSVQDVYKFTKFGDARRIIAGTIESGALRVGDELMFYPSGKTSRVKSLEAFNAPEKIAAETGEAVGITLTEQIYVTRGDVVTRVKDQAPKVATRLRVSLFWLGREALKKNKEYILKVGTARVPVVIEKFIKVIDASNLDAEETPEEVKTNNVAECVLRLTRAIAADEVSTFSNTSRFVLVDNFQIAGGGIIQEALPDAHSKYREQTFLRNIKWIHGLISVKDRSERYSQRPSVLLVTGEFSTDRKALGRALEARLFASGRIPYFMGIGNLIHGLDSDIEKEENPNEHIRRLAELSNIMVQAGMVFIVSAANISADNITLIKELVGEEHVKSIWLGEKITTDISPDLHLPEERDLDSAVELAMEFMYQNKIVFSPW